MFYDYRSYWGVTDHAGEEGEKYAGEGLAWFVAGSIANYDQYGPMIASTGNQQWQGVRLIVKWRELVCYKLNFLRTRDDRDTVTITRKQILWLVLLNIIYYILLLIGCFPFQYITLGMILAINLIFGIFIVIKANAVFCKDDSFLSIARLLRRK